MDEAPRYVIRLHGDPRAVRNSHTGVGLCHAACILAALFRSCRLSSSKNNSSLRWRFQFFSTTIYFNLNMSEYTSKRSSLTVLLVQPTAGKHVDNERLERSVYSLSLLLSTV